MGAVPGWENRGGGGLSLSQLGLIVWNYFLLCLNWNLSSEKWEKLREEKKRTTRKFFPFFSLFFFSFFTTISISIIEHICYSMLFIFLWSILLMILAWFQPSDRYEPAPKLLTWTCACAEAFFVPPCAKSSNRNLLA